MATAEASRRRVASVLVPALSRRQLLAFAGLGAVAACSRAATHRAAGGPATQASTTAPATPSRAATTTAPHTGPAVEVSHGDRSRRQVALTFHGAGEPSLAEALLTEAETRRAPLTIFAVGSWLAANPTMAGRILHGGHELANHTYHHLSDLPQLPAAQVFQEVSTCRDLIRTQTGQTGGYVRPSAVQYAPAQVLSGEGSAGYATSVAYDVDPQDYRDPGAELIVSRTAAALRPGSIVSLHLGHPGTVQALPRLLDLLHSRGLTPVTVTELLR